MKTGLRIRILMPCPPRNAKRAWGDYYFAKSLGTALERQGCRVRYEMAKDAKLRTTRWAQIRRKLARREIEIVLRGKKTWCPLPGKITLMWLISQSDTVDVDELGAYDHVFVASPGFLGRIAGFCRSASLMFQCTDASLFYPDDAVNASDRVLFVGNARRGVPRRVVEAVLSAGHPMDVWGKGWDTRLDDRSYRGNHIQNEDLAGYYRRAGVVLNDHTDAMRADGFVSNRVYDVAACGRPIVTEDMDGFPDGVKDGVYCYDAKEDAARAVAAALADACQSAGRRQALSDLVLSEHTFDTRARDILETIKSILSRAGHVPDASVGT